MKLKNKRTGEIVDIHKSQILIHFDGGKKTRQFKSLDELCEEYEDYKEPKEYWFLNSLGEAIRPTDTTDWTSGDADYHKKIGNYFETKEEAEIAAKKLKALKRLRDKGFEFIGIGGRDIEFTYPDDCCNDRCFWQDLDLLFGDKE